MERIERKKYGQVPIVLQRYENDDYIKVKQNETLKTGDLLAYDLASNTFVKINDFTALDSKFNGKYPLRIYLGEDITAGENQVVAAFRKGKINGNEFPIYRDTDENNKLKIKYMLETINIFIEEAK